MKKKEFLFAITAALGGLLITMVVMGLTCQKAVDLQPFKELARNAYCADISNPLFLIDKKMLFWDHRGNCPDNSYAYILYGKTPEEELCSRRDSITGPIESCEEEHQEMFDTIINNLDQSDLGLSQEHQVEPISFGISNGVR